MRIPFAAALAAAVLVLAQPALAQKKYGPGVTDTEIKIGQTQPYSGFGSAYSTIGKASAAYFTMINEQGGINGRKINFLSWDDGFSPGKTVEQTRKLVEQENVLFMFDSVGTPTNLAVQKYLNTKGIPQLFAGSGATRWDDPKHFPWTIGWQPAYRTEGRVLGRYILATKPNGKIGALFQDDDYGHDYLNGLRDVLGDKTDKMFVARQTYSPTDPTIDSQMVFIQAAGADVLADFSQPKFTAMAIRKAYDLGWHPLHVVNSVSTSVDQVLKPAGLDKSVGLIAAVYQKDPTDPAWKGDAGLADYLAFMKKYYPAGKPEDGLNVYGYAVAQTLVAVLKQCGDNLTRENVMKQATSLHGLQLPMLLPGVVISTSPTDYRVIKDMQIGRFNGTMWQRLGGIVSGG
ncbi:MAG TPA: ABC transporter substrate-binding protein [Stellaceae bacterium]|nr:ABC transporter substrate-binding protein [Stellaceae bacterium]